LYVDDVAVEKVRYENGYLLLPDPTKPGLGIDVDWDKVERMKDRGFSWSGEAVANLQDRTAHSS
jgi:muconate cycloisomerase